MSDQHIDEIKLTSFALGELEGGEADEIKNHVSGCGACRQEVEAIRETGGRLGQVLAGEQAHYMKPLQKTRIHEELGGFTPRRRILPWVITSAAAALLIGLVIISISTPTLQRSTAGDRVAVDNRAESNLTILSGKPATIEESYRKYKDLPLGAMHQDRRLKAGEGFERDGRGIDISESESRFNTESYDTIVENTFLRAGDYPFSTFSIDVDTASYANVRRMLNQGQLPPAGAVRIEEMINYFTYDYPQPKDEHPFSVNAEIGGCPWSPRHRLVRIGLKGKEIKMKDRKPSNLVFLIDVSGSMQPENKLPLVKRSLKLLTQQLDERDYVTMVVYAGSSGCVLEPTNGENKQRIIEALDHLQAGGSTHGSEGIQLAYQMAGQHFIQGGVNRVILCTDGDFNVGITNRSDLTKLIEEKAKSGVFLSVLGFGMGNYKDATLEELTNKGNGNYAYIDTLNEARKVLVEQMSGTLITIAKDVKIQIEFNPARVNAYRLIGYENRMLRKEDFDDDKKDAGEIGAGHTVTALYEIVPAGVEIDLPKDGDSRYQKTNKELTPEAMTNEIMLVKLRYKQPEGDTSALLKVPVEDSGRMAKDASADFRFASAVAEFGMLLRSSQFKDRASFEDVISLAKEAQGADQHGYRAEFIKLAEQAERLSTQRR